MSESALSAKLSEGLPPLVKMLADGVARTYCDRYRDGAGTRRVVSIDEMAHMYEAVCLAEDMGAARRQRMVRITDLALAIIWSLLMQVARGEAPVLEHMNSVGSAAYTYTASLLVDALAELLKEVLPGPADLPVYERCCVNSGLRGTFTAETVRGWLEGDRASMHAGPWCLLPPTADCIGCVESVGDSLNRLHEIGLVSRVGSDNSGCKPKYLLPQNRMACDEFTELRRLYKIDEG